MKELKILIGDYEYEMIQEIFKKEDDFEPVTETDAVIVKTLRAIISPKNIVDDNVGGGETAYTTFKKIQEPENKEIDTNTKIQM